MDTSFKIFADENAFNRRFVVPVDTVYTFTNEANNYNYFMF